MRLNARTLPPVAGIRLLKAQRYLGGDTTTIGEYRYLPLTRRSPRRGGHRAALGKLRLPRRVKGLPDNRRASKVVTHCGVEAVAGDGGNATVHYYYSSQWQILEARNGSNQATRQWVWGTQYVDEPLLMDVNGEPGTNNTCDPDVTDATSVKDRRYYYQQDRNWNVVALLEADDTQGTAGRCVERYAYSPYGEFLVLKGENASGNLGNALVASTVGNPFTHQGLPFDQEKGSYQNRHREYATLIQRFAQRDSLPRQPQLYAYLESQPLALADPTGLGPCSGPCCSQLDDGSSLGTAGCEGGSACYCIYTNRLPPLPIVALIIQCSIVHEENHNQTDDNMHACSHWVGRCCGEVPDGVGSHTAGSECSAHSADMQCIGSNASSYCQPGQEQCWNDVRDWLAETRAACLAVCGNRIICCQQAQAAADRLHITLPAEEACEGIHVSRIADY